jgi:uncharacterized membrane protein YbaN (DUF454 family)
MESSARRRGPRSRSRPVRVLFNIAGIVALGLGLAGIFLPLLPTTPFVLLAAACFARGSERFHQWLLANRTFGPMVHEWESHRSLPYRTKVSAIVLMSLTMAVSIVFFVQPLWLKIALALFGLALALWMYRIPSRDRPIRPSS